MPDRYVEFYTVLDRMAEGAYSYGDNVADGNQIRGAEGSLANLASAALTGAGIPHRSVHMDWDFEQVGASSVVRKIYVRTGGSRRRHPSTSYAMRIQPEGYTDEYAKVSDLARTIAYEAGLRTPRIYASDPGTIKRHLVSFTIEDFAEGVNGYDYCADNPDRLPAIARELGAMLPIIHQRQVEGFGFFDLHVAERGELAGQHPTYRSHVTAGIGRTLGHLLEYAQITESQAGALYRYFQRASIFDRVSEDGPVLSHGDPALYNLRVPEKGPSTLTDFGETRAAPKLHDLAVTSLDLTRDGWESATNDVLAGYEAASGSSLPAYTEEAIVAIRLRHLVSVIAGQTRFLDDNPEHTGMHPFFTRAIDAFHRDADTLRIINADEFPPGYGNISTTTGSENREI